MIVGHRPVFLEEVVEQLQPRHGGTYCDATVGAGGHTRALLQASPHTRVIGVDCDQDALSLARKNLEEFRDRVQLVHGNYRDLSRLLRQAGVDLVDGLLVDAGVSSMQLESAERGFSFRYDGPLDMRMDRSCGSSASDLLDELSTDDLTHILRHYGDVKKAHRLARAIRRAASENALTRTTDLAELTAKVVRTPRHKKHLHPATLVFQAIRIAVNDEIQSLEACLEQLASIVRPGGRAVFISFHSGEDRAVKQSLRFLAGRCRCPKGLPICSCGADQPRIRILTPKPLEPTPREVQQNPRARSARLRACEVIAA